MDLFCVLNVQRFFALPLIFLGLHIKFVDPNLNFKSCIMNTYENNKEVDNGYYIFR